MPEALGQRAVPAVAQAEALPAVDARQAEVPAQPELAVDPVDEMLDAAIQGAIARPKALPNVDVRALQVEPHRLAARALVWLFAGAARCSGSKLILGPAFSPPEEQGLQQVKSKCLCCADAYLHNFLLLQF